MLITSSSEIGLLLASVFFAGAFTYAHCKSPTPGGALVNIGEEKDEPDF